MGAVDQGVRVGEEVEQFVSRGLELLRVDVDARADGRAGEPLGRPAGTAVRRGGRAPTARDALLGDPDGGNAGQCLAYAAEQIDLILDRAADRSENTPDVETVLDRVVTP